MENWNMMNNMNPMNFNRMNNYNGYTPPAPRYELIKVNGEAGARNFRMAPNSQALLLDETAPIIWLAQTDGTGYLTVAPYDITPHQQAQPIDINNLAARVAQLEELINAKQSNFGTNKQPKKQRQHDAATMESSSNTTD